MFQRILYLIICQWLLLFTSSTAQYQNIWAFGNNAGIDFNQNPPEPIQTSIRTSEGSASICDDQGHLLFYTDGDLVWDRTHNVMPNGNDLSGTGANITSSSSQGTVIVPKPGSGQIYYIFSLGELESGISLGSLYYSVVDMSLNNGLGAVVADRKGILLAKGHLEQMTAVTGGNCDIWLLLTLKLEPKFVAYHVNFNGIDTLPVTSAKVAGSGRYGGIIGSIDVSPDRSKLAIAQGNLVLYDFDRHTGKITLPVILDRNASPPYYGVCFSPDNNKLYASTEFSGPSLYQFDLNNTDTNAIIASKTELGVGHGAVKRGPDGKVYCARHGNALSVINLPNLAGVACQYVDNGLPLLAGTRATFGLPNSGTIVVNRKVYSATRDTVYCSDSFLLEAAITSGINYVWDDGDKVTSRYVHRSGTYWVSYGVLGSDCEEHADTFHVVLHPVKRTYSTTTFTGMCAADSFLMVAASTEAPHYIWEDGSTERTRKMNRSGTFWVSYQNDSACEHFVDTFLLSYPHKDYEVSFSLDSLICQQQVLALNNTSDPHYQIFNWSLGDGQSSVLKNPAHLYTLPGSYKIMLTGSINEKCHDTVTQQLLVDSILPIRFVVDRDEICVGEFINVSHQMNGSSIQEIVWQWGNGHQLNALTEYTLQHAYDSAGVMPVTMRIKFRACPIDSLVQPVQVFALPKVHLYSENGMCFKGAPLTLKNIKQDTSAGYRNLWSTGSSADSIRVTRHGRYSLTIMAAPLGCSTTDTLEIAKDCYIDIPNAFTPNGDGVNDYFFPRQLLSKGINDFNLKIFNRWGQPVFETEQMDGRGWDGRFNDKDQPLGVYIYIMEIGYPNGQQEQYRGNVTLIR